MNLLKKVLMVMVAMVALVSMTGCYSKPNSGEIGVIRNGGPFDDHKIRGIVKNGEGNTWVGWMSTVHYYPVDSQQRFFRMQTCIDKDRGAVPCDGADSTAITVPTSDGMEVTISGTFYLNTAFNDSAGGMASVKDFDTQFGTRTFGGDNLHAYDGNSGWSAYLGQIVEPILQNNLRQTIAGVMCAELVSSCALVQNNGTVSAEALKNKNNQTNVQTIQDRVNQNLASDLKSTLGGKQYFTNLRFNLSKVELPVKVQEAVDTTMASFAAVSQAQARVQQASKDAEANIARQKGYNACPACQKIDEIKSLPRGLTALGGNFAIGVGK